jgi:hypothetical protein
LSSSIRRFCACTAVAGLLFAVASPAEASPETLRRSASNILFSPLDMVFTPVVAGRAIYHNMRDIDDTLGVRVFYVVPGYAWNMGVNFGASAVRMISGLLELVPGVLLLPFDADMDPLFAPGEKANALVDIETPPLYVKFGIDYTSVPY